MATNRSPWLVAACALLLLFPAPAFAVPRAEGRPQDLFVVHQLTNRTHGTVEIGSPVLSADSRWGVYDDSPGVAESLNTIYLIDSDSRQTAQVDAYKPLCNCKSDIDISADGATAIPNDAVQIRIVRATTGNKARQLIALQSNELSAVRLSGDGHLVVFLVLRGTTTNDGKTSIPRGVWAIAGGWNPGR